ncbi:hypothetical protein ACU8NW_16765 [Rhizobium leguminosarum]
MVAVDHRGAQARATDRAAKSRAVLAYHLAFMKTVFQFSSALTAPMVIDSPNQQDQDATNVAAMIALILSTRPNSGQTILGTLRLHD